MIEWKTRIDSESIWVKFICSAKIKNDISDGEKHNGMTSSIILTNNMDHTPLKREVLLKDMEGNI